MFAQLVWNAITQIISALLQNFVGDYGKTQVNNLLHKKAFQQHITTALQQARQRFAKELARTNPAALHALQEAQYDLDPTVTTLLGEIATEPRDYRQQLDALVRRLQELGPSLSRQRCHAAAKLLVQAIQSAVGDLPEMRNIIRILREEQIIDGIDAMRPSPPYEAGLREAIEAAARTLVIETRQGYITAVHLLYALATLPNGVTRRLLGQLGVDSDALKEAIRTTIKPHQEVSWIPSPRTPPRSSSTRRRSPALSPPSARATTMSCWRCSTRSRTAAAWWP